MSPQIEVEAMALDTLRQLCAQEGELDPRSCYELFRRAIQNGDQLAWEAVFDQYSPRAASWVERHPLFPALREESEYFVNWAFTKMWRTLSPEKLARFYALAPALRYLQMCIHSALVDFARLRAWDALTDEYVDPIDETATTPGSPGRPSELRVSRGGSAGAEEQAYSHRRGESLWNLLGEHFQDDRERRAAYGTFVLALTPEQVQAQYPARFQDTQEVMEVEEALLGRLRQDESLVEGLNLDREITRKMIEERLTSVLYRAFCPSSMDLGELTLAALPGKRAAEVRAHLAECPHCSRELDQLGSFLESLAPEVGPAMKDGVEVWIGQLVPGGLTDIPGGEPGPGSGEKVERLFYYRAGSARLTLEVQDDPHQPESRALLVQALDIEATGLQARLSRGGREQARAVLDDEGRFIFSGLEPGSYELNLTSPQARFNVYEVTVA